MSEARVRTPKLLTSARDARALELSMADGFLLSCIDGETGEGDLAIVTGRSQGEIRASLAKLEALGLIKIDEIETPDRPAPRRAAPAADRPKARPGASRASIPVGAPRQGSTRPAGAPILTPLPPSAAVGDDSAAMTEDVDLEPKLRTDLLSLYRALDQVDHYALLGIDRGANKQDTKRAYYALAAKFHPDRYFRKRLGTFKVRMEALFSRLTLAHETLSNAEKRAEYDLYLDEQRKLRGIESVLAETAREVQRAHESVEREVRGEEPTPLAPLVADATPTSPLHVTPKPARLASEIDPAVRREALARRLLGGRSTPGYTVPPARPSGTPPPMTTTTAMDSLRRRYEDRVMAARGVEARKYAARAEEALKANRIAAAASAFQVAAGLAPGDEDLKRKAAAAQAQADSLLGESYSRQAEYEEKNGQWLEAARSWAGACRARPDDPHVHERAARAALKVGGDLREAIPLAQRAVSLDPDAARGHATLGEIYLAAGRAAEAKREFETAVGLDPHDDSISQMLKKVSKLA